MELSLLILVCIHKSYIVYLEIYVVLIGHGFSFFLVMEKSWKINVEKEGGPLIDKQSGLQSQSFHVMILNNFDTLSAAWQCVTPLWSIKLVVVCQTLAMQLISPSQWLVKSK